MAQTVPSLFASKLIEARFHRRYKRFFADIEINGEVLQAHVPNTGSLKSCLFENARCLVTLSDDPKRKLKATLQFLETPTSWVGVNTQLTNTLASLCVKQKLLPHWQSYPVLQKEFKISPESRLDFRLSREDIKAPGDVHFMEVKNVTYAEDKRALFPDAVTTRGQKHLIDLMDLRKKGHGSEILFIVQREDCHEFSAARAIDPDYAKLLVEAVDNGVQVSAASCTVDFKNLSLKTKILPVVL